MITQNELVKISTWNKKTLRQFCYEKTLTLGSRHAVSYLIAFRAHLHVALEEYSKKHNYDLVQHNIIRIVRLIEKWCGEYFKEWAKKEILKRHPSYFHNQQKLKGKANELWEIYLRKHSYRNTP